ncbi:hypothetical protein IGB42_01963 [Andreprevotia sp. IGB-42]|uniref:DUF1007 family protein n=1 Tax=Andreprevotia sp. IGB-42 TaxID=2497473 RepID=UPI0013577428|nr:DUF1007 family protein [Andreprevotia sp. IGB-42]KAF0813612.1 hypothetical protein IGB42_01963 [Andreprevotia sp. IGB-42]
MLARIMHNSLPILLFTLLTAPLARAHPHVWAVYQTDVVIGADGNFKLHEAWTFDEAFSSMLLGDLRPKADIKKPLSSKEQARLKVIAFDNLARYGYFNVVRGPRGPLKFKPASGFAARLEKGKLSYTFVLEPADPQDVRKAPLDFGIWDETFYIAMQAAGDDTIAIRQSPFKCTLATREDKGTPLLYGMVFPPVTRLTCR